MDWIDEIIVWHDGWQVSDAGDFDHWHEARDKAIREHRNEIAILLSRAGFQDLQAFEDWCNREPVEHGDNSSVIPHIVVDYLRSSGALEGNPELVTIEQAAEVLAISPESVRRLDLPTVQVGKRAVRYDLRAVRKFIADGGLAE